MYYILSFVVFYGAGESSCQIKHNILILGVDFIHTSDWDPCQAFVDAIDFQKAKGSRPSGCLLSIRIHCKTVIKVKLCRRRHRALTSL